MNHIRHIIGWLFIVASIIFICLGVCYGISEDRAFHARVEADEVQGFSMAYIVTVQSCVIAFIPLVIGVLMVRKGRRKESNTDIITNLNK